MKIENLKLKIIYLSIPIYLLFAICYLPQAPAYADSISLSVSPSLLHVQAIPNVNSKSALSLENQGSESLKIQVLLKPFLPSGEAGQIKYFKDSDVPDSYKKILTGVHITDQGIVTSSFDLGPQQKKNLELVATLPEANSSSDYYFSVVFLASPESLTEAGLASPESAQMDLSQPQPDDTGTGNAPQYKNFSTLNAGIATNVLLSIGNENPQGYIDEFSAPGFLESGPVNFTVRIKNSGKQLIIPRGIIFIKNMFGQTIGRLDLAPANILADSTRTLTNYSSSNLSGSLSPITYGLWPNKILWPEKFLLGPYTATLNLAISDQGPIYNRSIVFFALPVPYIIGIIIFLLIAITVVIRLRYHLKHDK